MTDISEMIKSLADQHDRTPIVQKCMRDAISNDNEEMVTFLLKEHYGYAITVFSDIDSDSNIRLYLIDHYPQYSTQFVVMLVQRNLSDLIEYILSRKYEFDFDAVCQFITSDTNAYECFDFDLVILFASHGLIVSQKVFECTVQCTVRYCARL